MMIAIDGRDRTEGNRRSHHLPRQKECWPQEAKAACDRLLRELDAWARSTDCPTTSNGWIAEESTRQAWRGPGWHRPIQPLLRVSDEEPLARHPRAWAATWRYRLAFLERQGMARAAAMRLVRAEHDAALKRFSQRCA